MKITAEGAGVPLAAETPAAGMPIPGGLLSVLAGHPAACSLLAHQVAAAVASGRPWLDVVTRRGPVLAVAAASGLRRAHRRREAINQAAGGPAELRALHWAALVGDDALAICGDRATPGNAAGYWPALVELAGDMGAALVVLGAVPAGPAAVIAGNARWLAWRTGAAVLLIAPPGAGIDAAGGRLTLSSSGRDPSGGARRRAWCLTISTPGQIPGTRIMPLGLAGGVFVLVSREMRPR